MRKVRRVGIWCDQLCLYYNTISDGSTLNIFWHLHVRGESSFPTFFQWMKLWKRIRNWEISLSSTSNRAISAPMIRYLCPFLTEKAFLMTSDFVLKINLFFVYEFFDLNTWIFISCGWIQFPFLSTLHIFILFLLFSSLILVIHPFLSVIFFTLFQ
jgi:hypothetical protein